jgi:hypothetical protein
MNYKAFILIIVVIILIYIIYVLFNKKGYVSSLNNAKNLITITPESLDPTNSNSSNYSLTIWFYVEDWNYNYGKTKPLLLRGTGAAYNISTDCSQNSFSQCLTNLTADLNSITTQGIKACPGILLGESVNNLYIIQSIDGSTTSASDYQNTISSFILATSPNPLLVSVVENFPIQKWVNLTISFYNRSLDIYLDGKLVKTTIFPNIAYIDKTLDMLITPNGGFAGMTSGFQYYPYSLNPDQVWDIYKKGYDNNTFFGDSLSKYKIKFSLMEGDIEDQSFQI